MCFILSDMGLMCDRAEFLGEQLLGAADFLMHLADKMSVESGKQNI